MKYQITCAHCNKRFLVEGKGGQTIECTCPGCDGKMRVTLPKTKDDDANTNDDAHEEYQKGYVPDNYGDMDNGGDDGDKRKQHRALALGCMFIIVIAAAAIVAFMALNHTTKKPIDDPYEYVEPDTDSVDSVPADSEDVETDTIQVHQEEPKEEAAPEDTVTKEPAADDGEATEQDESSSSEDEGATNAPANEHRSSTSQEQPAKQQGKTAKPTKPTKKADAAASAND